MTAQFTFNNQVYTADLTRPHDLSIPIEAGPGKLSAWYVDPVSIEPVRSAAFTGSVAEGGSVNFRTIVFNPHGHATHTECMGHITSEVHSVNRALTTFFYPALLTSVTPRRCLHDTAYAKHGDHVIHDDQIPEGILPPALIIRTRPNEPSKKQRAHSDTNPPFLAPEAALKLVSGGVEHLLIDLPSVDRELDEGRLTAHHIFWGLPGHPRGSATITELIFVADDVPDGMYLLNLQTAPFVNDATPSRPLLFAAKPR